MFLDEIHAHKNHDLLNVLRSAAGARANPLFLFTTTEGYEGTGRGFVLRFLAWAARQTRPLERLTLRAPIRWGEDDPLERAVTDLSLIHISEPTRPY